LIKRAAAVLVGVTACLLVARADLQASASGESQALQVQLHTTSSGNRQWDYLDASEGIASGERTSRHVPTRRPGTYCYYGRWVLTRVEAASGARHYGVFLRNACDGDNQVFPFPATSCNNDDSQHPVGRFSYCVTIVRGHIPAGLTPAECAAAAVASTALNVSMDPPSYDSSQPVTQTLTTSFSSDAAELLSEGSCTGVIDWQDIGWTIRWADGAVDTVPGSGHSGITATHQLAPSGSGTTPADANVTAHLHIHGTAVDFDGAGNLITVARDALVDISNHAGAAGAAAAPVYTPPVLEAGAASATQNGDGSLPPGPQGAVGAHLNAIRGRLELVFPAVLVVRPGTESIGGVVIGSSTSSVVSWSYGGPATDAPASPRHSGSGGQSLAVQWNHAERTDGHGGPIDESLPLTVTVRTVYPDGTARTDVVSGSIGVSIHYPALAG
jgi:hypothetical protein